MWLPFAVVHAGLGELGQITSTLPGGVAPVWPPSGVAMGATLLVGLRLLPAIWIGAFAGALLDYNWDSAAVPLVAAAAAAVGSTLESLVGVVLFRKFARPGNFTESTASVVALIVAALAACGIGASIGPTALCSLAVISWSNYGEVWLTWWLGDVVGMLVFAPLILIWHRSPPKRWGIGWLELSALLAAVVATEAVVFMGYPLEYLAILMLIWVTFRLDAHCATTMIVVTATMSVAATMGGRGYYVRGNLNHSLLLVQVYVAVVAITPLFLLSVLSERRSATARLAAKAAQTDFLASMSHELRTPLNGVLGYAQVLLRDRSLTVEQRESLGAIRTCGRHLLTLINDVLDLSKIESGKLELSEEIVDLQELLEGTREVLAPRAAEKQIELNLEIAPEIPRSVLTDPTKLNQVLVNLAGNALKFTDEGAVTIRVTEPTIGRIRFQVQDTGVGMSESELARVFDAFSQGRAGKDAGGTGLGLSISRRIVESLGGEISASSETALGSCFSFELPMQEANLPSDLSAPDLLDDSMQLVVPSGRSLRVLIADDREENRDILRRMLEFPLVEVEVVRNGLAAIEYLQTSPVDVVLMDVRMPVMNGIEATRAIRRNPEWAATRIIAVSASVFENQRTQIRLAGCDDFLAKPVQATELYRAMAELCDLELCSSSTETELSDQSKQLLLPDDAHRIATRLADLVEVGDITALHSLTEELLASSQPERVLGERLEGLLRRFDLAEIRNVSEKLKGQVES